MSIDIPLGNLGGDNNISLALKQNDLDDVMSRALELPNGIEVEYADKKHAEAARFRFYRRVNWHRKRNVISFDALTITLSDNKLIFKRYAVPIIREL